MSDKILRQKIEQLHDEFRDWYSRYRADNPGSNPEIAGFNMPYSTASTWDTGNDVLILTTNPKSQPSEARGGMEMRPADYVSSSPWPQDNEMYSVKFKNQGKFLRAFKQVALGLGDDPGNAEKDYAMWSVVPYRTNNAGAIPDELWEMALYKVWGPVFGLWLPSSVIVFGSQGYEVIKDAINMHAFFLDERMDQPVPKKAYLRCARFISPDGKRISLFDLPHPSHNIGYYTGERSMAFEFVSRMRTASDKNKEFHQEPE